MSIIISFNSFTRPPVNCMVNKVIPFDKIEVLKFRHFHRSDVSKGKSPSTIDVDNYIRNGLDYQNFDQSGNHKPLRDIEKLSCWNDIYMIKY